jgi:hypothetical protein
LKTKFSSEERKLLKSGSEQCDATMKRIIGTMKDTIKIIQHIQTYIDIGERRSGLERHCETIPAQSESKLNQKNSNSTNPQHLSSWTFWNNLETWLKQTIDPQSIK